MLKQMTVLYKTNPYECVGLFRHIYRKKIKE